MADAHLKEKLATATGSISGAASIMGSWQVCHSICLGLIALLGIIGITITGMPLLFLNKIAIPLWSIAVILLGVTSYLYVTKKCISKNLILLNTGLIIAGIPFPKVSSFQPLFWIIGGMAAIFGLTLFIREKLDKKKCRRHHHG
ncbi:TPA: hypothetical protein HA361_01470 [Candidatus Woesearchaeota archaeon]|nr:hypothetical protein [Candidatus Woesearchaeota archaeon]HII68976.1 hypothetical protein [Candidatus Woesearchaeota archaeon]